MPSCPFPLASYMHRAVRAGGGGGGGGGNSPPPPHFERSVNPILTRGQIIPTSVILLSPSPSISRPSYGFAACCYCNCSLRSIFSPPPGATSEAEQPRGGTQGDLLKLSLT